mmetsp:Transcript_104394/g.261705  ORF Transcript_104394/g.261705 Transcript_104394/m.261705 type:complete len:302 (-) Transcript_104394:296-1201(-)|eukprot:CAMPEP_0115463852 /NCGR_PEP_ID=MMETSP0271-20121206/48574_1 /TAXON_ID=71861 /ORGANISM="Scrippsiella trochoidea, Strain CCMP3099" /LENGTH=301 /DNA_ID=CAMNT_0002890725 /DNA_START=21 /DNA_END=926 /DNA_ORIENTATION=+
MAGVDPVLELMGWKAEPLLCRRLNLYLVEELTELASLVGSLYLSQVYLNPHGLFVRLLVLPFIVVVLKLWWTLRLVCSYYYVRGADLATVIRRMGHVHSRSFWQCSAAMLTCLSCVLMVWHAIMFLLMTGYGPTSDVAESFAKKFLLGSSAFFVLVNWALWRDFVNNYKDTPEEPDDVKLLYAIFKMHKSKAIRMFKHNDLADREVVPTSCVVCLEDFKVSETVAQLPCGHIFHPTCAHKWILEDWRCPFRCSLDPQKVASSHAESEFSELPSLESVDLESGHTSRPPTPPAVTVGSSMGT